MVVCYWLGAFRRVDKCIEVLKFDGFSHILFFFCISLEEKLLRTRRGRYQTSNFFEFFNTSSRF